MANVHWNLISIHRTIFEALYFSFHKIKLCFYSLFYNEFADKYYIGDTAMEPMFWVVDHFAKILGPVCVAGVLLLMSSVIAIAYVIGLPFWLDQSILATIVLLVIGNWILVNVLFNYFMAYATSPGYPPQGALIPEAVSICRKCIAPKPPRTHHCSVCNLCILKMDHHCPWLNNCIGHFNHRYFYMFCIYVWIGIIFIMIFGMPIAWVHFSTDVKLLNSTFVGITVAKLNETFNQGAEQHKRTLSEALYHSSIVYIALLSVATFVSVGVLLIWHSRLISKGETSIERHINKKESQRLSAENKVFKNPYDYGHKKNWALFLGMHDGRTWWHIIFPSTHKPEGSGLQWDNQNFDIIQLFRRK